MRNSYPVSTIELNDKLLLCYEHLVYLLGISTDSVTATGLYDQIDASGLAFMTNQSGIPHAGANGGKYDIGLDYESTSIRIIDYQRSDYLLKKYLGVIDE
jgi:hypothetical protein